MDGILNIYKEKGYTSHDVVAKLRGILHQKKIGHTGTLDPQAEGVLPVCLGSATKLCDMLTDHKKVYRAEFLLGRTTDTQDIFGQTEEESDVIVNPEEVASVITSFVGEYEQIPPMYSAKKINGKKLYELAREGKKVERRASRVTIFSIQILKIDLPYVEIEVDCSKGTYIRTLCHDIGQALGCGACMTKLLRTQVGDFVLDQALTLEEVEEKRDEKILEKWVIPVESVFETYPKVIVKQAQSRLLYNGNHLLLKDLEEENPEMRTAVRVYDSQGNFLAVYSWNQENEDFKPIKMFLRSGI